jgi:outer membrane protein TolC
MFKHGIYHKKLWLLAGCFFIIMSCFSQESETNSLSESGDTLTISADSIPSLQFFIDAALVNSPLLALTDEEINKIKEEIKLEKTNWLDLISLDANAKYGLYNQLLISESTGGGDPDASLSNKTQLNYFAGITVKIPLSEFLSKKSKVKVLQTGIDQAELKRKAQRREISTLIVESYFNLKIKLDAYENSQENYQAVYIGYLTAKRDIEKGLIKLDDYSNSISKKTSAQASLSKTKFEFYSEYNKLLILTGLSNYVK